jgi:hypothetical protein
MIEVADLEVQEQIKKVDAAFTWPHHSEKGYFVSAIFVRTDKEEKYLIYCPRSTAAISLDEYEYNPYLLWGNEKSFIREIKLNQTLSKTGDILFYVIALGNDLQKEVKKEEIEKLFGIKVV